MKTHYNLHQSTFNREYGTTFRLDFMNVCDGFKVYKRLIPNMSTKTEWIIARGCVAQPLELLWRRSL